MRSRRVFRGFGIALVLLALGSRANATTLFFDDFNSENGGNGALNYTAFANFTITSGTVDLCGGAFCGLLPASTGMYIDLDGSSNNAGLMTENGFALGAGDYALQFDLAGSHRNSTEIVTVKVFGGLNANYATSTYTLFSNDPLTTMTMLFTLGAADTIKFSFDNFGGDNVGALLDNVRLSSVDPVPEPASLVLLGSGLFGVAARIRRRRATRA